MNANEATICKFKNWQLARTPVNDDMIGCQVLNVDSLAVAVREDHAELLKEELGCYLQQTSPLLDVRSQRAPVHLLSYQAKERRGGESAPDCDDVGVKEATACHDDIVQC